MLPLALACGTFAHPAAKKNVQSANALLCVALLLSGAAFASGTVKVSVSLLCCAVEVVVAGCV